MITLKFDKFISLLDKRIKEEQDKLYSQKYNEYFYTLHSGRLNAYEGLKETLLNLKEKYVANKAKSKKLTYRLTVTLMPFSVNFVQVK